MSLVAGFARNLVEGEGVRFQPAGQPQALGSSLSNAWMRS